MKKRFTVSTILSILAGVILALLAWFVLPAYSGKVAHVILSGVESTGSSIKNFTDAQIASFIIPFSSPSNHQSFRTPIPLSPTPTPSGLVYTTTEPQQSTETLTQNILTTTGVNSLQGLQGDLLLKAGKAIQIDGLTISNGGVTSFQGTTGDVTLTAGSGLSIDGVKFENTDRGSTQNIFKNIAVAGQDTIEANTNDTTLTVVAGTGITLTTDSANRQLTIAGVPQYSDTDARAATGFTHTGTTVHLTTATVNSRP